jgi:hypothetical protein
LFVFTSPQNTPRLAGERDGDRRVPAR